MTLRRQTLLFLFLLMLPAGFAGAQAAAQSSAAQTGTPAMRPDAIAAEPAAPADPQQAYTLPPRQLARAIQINRIRDLLNIAGSIWEIVFLWLLLTARGWAGIEAWARRISSKRWIQGAVFFAVFIIVTALSNLPLDWIGQHYERAYGISVQGWAGWFGDELKALGVALLAGVPLLLLFNRIVQRWPRRYWLGAWVATLPIMVFFVFLMPLLAPIFDKFEPLQKSDPALVTELEKVVARTGTHIPPDRVYLMKASEKTNGLNAYVSGIGATKRIVVWDTTAGRIPDDEVLFIFGHEAGHYVLRHIPKGLACAAVGLFFAFWACAACAAWLARRFGARWGASELSSRTGFVVLLFTVSIASFLMEPVSNAISRHFEHQADVFGQEAIHGVVPDPQKTAVAAFNALGRAWLEAPNPNRFIEFWLYSHPSVEQRANFAARYDPWKNEGHGKYFKD